MTNHVKIYDTTLRDGAQSHGISFSLEDKLRITAALDAFGAQYIEAGRPSANPKDEHFYQEMKNTPLRNATLVAFGSTHRPGLPPGKDPAFRALLRCGASAAAVVGKASRLHITDVLKISLDENLRLIAGTIKYLKKHGLEVFFDAEHFFDGFLDSPDCALHCLRVAVQSGAGTLVLCDTNGGRLPWEIEEIVARVRETFPTPLGVHLHNDAGLAVAGTLAAVRGGAALVQVTVNGYGERCGNADLCAVVPNLVLKMGVPCIPENKLRETTSLARFVSELANRPMSPNQPFAGERAFSHKAGIHVDAVRKNPVTYEHVPPEAVGNRRGVLISDQSGKANVLHLAERMNLDLSGNPAAVRAVLKQLKRAEFEGFTYEGAEGSFEILVKKSLGEFKPFFELEGLRVVITKRERGEDIFSEATIRVRMGDKRESTAAEGDGPVNALDNALRKALVPIYPCLADVRLTDYKVRVLDERKGTAAMVRVLITSRDKHNTWNTVGVSSNVIQASWLALVDSIEYKLLREMKNSSS